MMMVASRRIIRSPAATGPAGARIESARQCCGIGQKAVASHAATRPRPAIPRQVAKAGISRLKASKASHSTMLHRSPGRIATPGWLRPGGTAKSEPLQLLVHQCVNWGFGAERLWTQRWRPVFDGGETIPRTICTNSSQPDDPSTVEHTSVGNALIYFAVFRYIGDAWGAGEIIRDRCTS
jgi:hypothetical protein